MTLAQDIDEFWLKAELYRLKGELLLRQDGSDIEGALLLRQDGSDIEGAETAFREALAVARDQQAKSWELRAATSLAKLWRDHDKRREARDLLSPVYDWFTEGFDTLDLKEAKALLDDLV